MFTRCTPFRIVLFVLALPFCTAVTAQEVVNAKDTTPPKPKTAPDEKADDKKDGQPYTVTVVATRSEQDTYEVPNQVDVVTDEDITTRIHSGNNFVDAFKELPGFHIQKTAHGQGSPFIRGFTSFRTLLMVDGIRINNSIMREGPNQYWATVDPLNIDHMDVMRGPGSSLYGSDAVGGVVNAVTKSTDTWENERYQELGDGTRIGGQAFTRFSLAERSEIGHLEVKGSHKDKVGFLLGGSYKDHDDFVAGGGTGLQEYTGYSEYSMNGKVQYRPAQEHELTFFVDKVHQDGVPRTQRTVYLKPFEGTAAGSDEKREFDQDRLLSYVRHRFTGETSVIQEAVTTLSYQNVLQQRFRIDNRNRRRFENIEVNTLGAQVQFKSRSPIGVLTYGADYFRDDVESDGKRFNADGTLNQVQIQGQVGDDAHYENTGLYIQTEKDFLDRLMTVTAGGRFEYITADCDKFDNNGTPDSVEKDWWSFVGSMRLMFRPDRDSGDHWHPFVGVQQSFRAPSIHDLTALDSTSVLELPSTNVEPEQFTTYEVGLKTQWDLPRGRLATSTSYYYTFIHNMMLRAPTGAFDPPPPAAGVPVVEKTNGGKGLIQGIECSLEYTFLDDYTLWGNVTWTEGDLLQYDGPPLVKVRKPADRLIPVMSHMGFKYEPKGKNWWVELHADVFSKADRLALGNRTDNRIPPNGTSGFGVFGIRGGARFFDDRLTVSGAVENIANEDYRIHGSGQNMPGTNFILSLKYDW